MVGSMASAYDADLPDQSLSEEIDVDEDSSGNEDHLTPDFPEEDTEDLLDITESTPFETMVAPPYPQIEQFVSRLYTIVLKRGYSASCLRDWASELERGATGAAVAFGFFFSQEFLNQNVSNEDFVRILYLTLLNRGAAAGCIADWAGHLNAGLPREDVFSGIVNSIEFTNLCARYGIVRGTYTPPPGGMARVFVTRFYRTILEREPDPTGLNDWTNVLVKNQATGASVAYSFIFSRELLNRNITDGQFVDRLYNAMLGRSADASGRADWVRELSSGASRYSVFVGFVNSPEFDLICRNHGITRGAVPPPTTSMPLYGRVVILDPGHGTAGSPGYAGYNEAVAMLDLALRMKPLLEAQGAKVIITRTNEVNIPISVRCAMINIEALRAVRATRSNTSELAEIDRLIGQMQSIIANPGVNGSILMNLDPFNAARTIHPDLRRIFEYTSSSVIRDNFLVISLHSNATTAPINTSVRGAEVYFIDPSAHVNTRTYFAGFSFTAPSRSFGNTLLNHINSTGIPRRAGGLRAENYAMIREINVPAVLAENGFHTNPQDRELLSNPAYRQNLAVAYRNAILEYFR